MSHAHSHAHPGRFHSGLRVVLVSVVVNLVLTLAQIAAGLLGNSQALVADGVHTLSDLIADFMVLFALIHGRKGADEEHPYGHARIETAVTVILGIILLVVGTGIAIRAGINLAQAQTFVAPSTITLWIAIFTLAAKEAMYHYTMRVARRFDSNMLRASAWHHRSDAISSLVVVAGIGGALVGFGYLDSIAAIVVALMVMKIGLGLAWQALRELVDTGLSHEDLERVRQTILGVTGVKALHMLRTRHVGEHALADVHIIVDEHLSVSEGHQIGEVVRAKLIENFDPIQDVTVHIDTEDDITATSCDGLPLRDEVLQRLQRYFRGIEHADQIKRTTLHYRSGRITIELVLPLSVAPNDAAAQALVDRFNAAISHDSQIQAVSVLFE